MKYPFVATCSRGAEVALAEELVAHCSVVPECLSGAVRFSGTFESAYRGCLWSRLASRLLHPLLTFEADDADALYEGARTIPWEEHLSPDRTLAVSHAGRSPHHRHSGHAALRVKDAVVDRLRDAHGFRPNVDTDHPDVRLHLHLRGRTVTVSLDLSGGPLHERGYRPRRASAPLKENLAATVLWLAGWPTACREGRPLLDLFTGSGTLLIEAACMAADVAPGLARRRHGFEGWLGHDAALWDRVVAEARARRDTTKLPMLVGYDADPEALEAARESLRRAGLDGHVRFERRTLAECGPPPGAGGPGLVVANPPYGVRLEDASGGDTADLHEALGDALRRRFPGYRAAVLTGNLSAAKVIGLRPDARHVLHNGPIECRLFTYAISEKKVASEDGPRWRRPTEEARMFENRLRKNRRKWDRWARQHGISCYRVYDADIPEFNLAVDRYGDEVVVQEYAPPRSIDPIRARARLRDAVEVVRGVLEPTGGRVHQKTRQRQRGGGQYERLEACGETCEVSEGGHRFLVNLRDYLDTGLFLDQRRLRAEVAEAARGRTFLNLFAYTASATVYAAKGGARESTSVDLSRTYLDWARKNLERNGVELSRHRLVRADCLRWLSEAKRAQRRYGVILLAPPTYSRSKSMEADMDIRRDHRRLLERVADLLEPGGSLFFVTHALDVDPTGSPPAGVTMEEISSRTVPPDFARSPHRAFVATRDL